MDVFCLAGDALHLDKLPSGLPFRLVMGSPVYGMNAADWDSPENRMSKHDLTLLVESVKSKSTAPRVTFAFLMPLDMCYDLYSTMTEVVNCGAEVVVLHFKNSPPANGPFYVNWYTLFILFGLL